MVSEMHNANSLDAVFMVWNFGLSSIGQLLKRYTGIKNYTKSEKNSNSIKQGKKYAKR
jgi:hypothetical protein